MLMKTNLVHLRLDASDKYTSEDFRDVVASLTPNYIITEEISKISKKNTLPLSSIYTFRFSH